MSKKLPFFTILMLLTVLAVAGCASAKQIPEGRYILKNNKVKILNSDGYTGSDLKKYLKQNDKENNIFGLKAIFKDPVLYDETMVEPSKVALKNHLQYLGYYDSKIDTTSVANKNKIKVTYLVTLGKKYPIDSIRYIVDNKDIREIFDKYPEDFSIKKGDILNEASLEAESEVLAKRLRNNGYFNFNRNYFFFSADTSTHKNVASLVVELKDYTRNETPEQAVPHRKFKIG
ncbi:MAG: hypothetical protein HUJ90_05195, partial [Bacteroidales bacterium]|nr:hypothetical protein [Bacteroidales bacterium]